MDEPQRATDDISDVSLTGPGGWGAKFRGSNELLLMLLLFSVSVGAAIYTIMNHEAQAKDREAASIQRDANITTELKNIGKAQHALIYVVSLDEKQRKALNLDKPEALREMQR